MALGNNVDKIGTAGMFVTALACPICWPLFATLGGALGLGILAPYEGIMMNYVFPPFVVIAMAGSVLSYRYHKSLPPLVTGLLSGALILFGFYVGWQLTLMYIGIFGLILASVLSYLANRRQAKSCQQ